MLYFFGVVVLIIVVGVEVVFVDVLLIVIDVAVTEANVEVGTVVEVVVAKLLFVEAWIFIVEMIAIVFEILILRVVSWI